MELKVWVDGIQRVVCGVTDQTTCQDIVIALAHATGQTGRFTLVEKWRDSEHLVGPEECPLAMLRLWGEYAGNVSYCLYRSSEYRPMGKEHTSPAKAFIRGSVKRTFSISGSGQSSGHSSLQGSLQRKTGGLPNGTRSEQRLKTRESSSFDSAEDHCSVSSYSSSSPYSSFQGGHLMTTTGHVLDKVNYTSTNGSVDSFKGNLLPRHWKSNSSPFSSDHSFLPSDDSQTLESFCNNNNNAVMQSREQLTRSHMDSIVNPNVQYYRQSHSATDEQTQITPSVSQLKAKFLAEAFTAQGPHDFVTRSSRTQDKNLHSATSRGLQKPYLKDGAGSWAHHEAGGEILQPDQQVSTHSIQQNTNRMEYNSVQSEHHKLHQLIRRQQEELHEGQSRLDQLDTDLTYWTQKEEDTNHSLQLIQQEIADLQSKASELDNEADELELVSWSDKLAFENRKQHQLQAELQRWKTDVQEMATKLQDQHQKVRLQTDLNKLSTMDYEKSLELKDGVKVSHVSDGELDELTKIYQELTELEEKAQPKEIRIKSIESQIRDINLELFRDVPLLSVESLDPPLDTGLDRSRSSSSRSTSNLPRRVTNPVQLLKEAIQATPHGQWV